jgi:hypothetical protein
MGKAGSNKSEATEANLRNWRMMVKPVFLDRVSIKR